MIDVNFVNALNVGIMFLSNIVFISVWGAIFVNFKSFKGIKSFISLGLIFIATASFSIKAIIIFVNYMNSNSNDFIITLFPFWDSLRMISFLVLSFIEWKRIDKKLFSSYLFILVFCFISVFFEYQYIKLILSFLFIVFSYAYYMDIIIFLKKNKKNGKSCDH